jgi:Recombinase
MPAFTISDAARHCGVDRRTLQRAIRTGRLALTAEHRLTPEALAQAGYLPAAPQGYAAGTPYDDAAGLPREPCDAAALYAAGPPQDTPQELGQATALLALLERLTTAITDLHEEVRSLRDDLRQMPQRTPQWRRRGAPTAPHETPQGTPRDTPHGTPQPSPQILGLYDPHAAAARIRDLRQQGLSYTMIALQLTQEGIPTRYGKPWEHSSVRYVLETYGRQEGT